MFHPPANVPPPIIKTWLGNGWIYKSLIFPAISVDFPSFVWIPIAGRWWQVLKWMPSEHSMPKYGDVALNNGMFSYANCWSNHHFFLIWICSTMIHPENRLNRFFLEHLVVENNSQVSIVTRGLLSWWVACCERASSCQRAPRKCRNLGSGWPWINKVEADWWKSCSRAL